MNQHLGHSAGYQNHYQNPSVFDGHKLQDAHAQSVHRQPHYNRVMGQNVNQNMHEEFEKYIDKLEEQEKAQKKLDRMRKYAILILPYFIFPRNVAAYFVATELVQTYLTDLGVTDEGTLLFLFAMHSIDIARLAKGRLSMVKGFKLNWYIDIFDYALSKLKLNDLTRIGSLMFFKHTAKPDYG